MMHTFVTTSNSEDVKWMSALPYTLSLPSLGCVVVHAGLVPGVDLHDQDAEAMSCMRNVVEAEGGGGGGGYEPRTLATQGAANPPARAARQRMEVKVMHCTQ